MYARHTFEGPRLSKILLIDDDREVRLSIRTVLESVGHEVIDCASAAEGMSAAKNNAFDAAIVDLILPDVDGLEVISEMRKNLPNLKVIAISGGGEMLKKSYLPVAEAFGAIASLEKPFEAQTLIDAVNNAVAT